MKKPKQLVLLTVITILFLSNIILAYNFLQKSNKYEQNINHLARNKVEFNTFVRKKQVEIDILSEQVKEKDSKIHSLREKLEKATKDNESPIPQISRGDKKNYTIQKFIVTSYTSGYESTGKYPSHPAYGITANGEKVKQGKTIACPHEMPFGTKVKIPEISGNIFECTDRGGKIKGKRLDVYMDRLSDAVKFGVKELEVVIFKEW